MSFLTAQREEDEGVDHQEGNRRLQAAGKIHTDFERGFIGAEVVAIRIFWSRDRLLRHATGIVRLEGKTMWFRMET